MRSYIYYLAGVIALAVAAQPLAAQGPVVKGILSDLVKDENAPTGSVTVVDAKGKPSKFVVTEGTKFVIVRGNATPRPTNFLAEHKGEIVAIFPMAKNPANAARVEIIQPAPPPPPPYIVRSAPTVGHVHGTAVHVDAKVVTIRLHEPPTPVLGVVTDIGVDPDTGVGNFTLNVNGKNEKFVATEATAFYKVKDFNIKRSSFLAEDRGQTVVVFPQPHQHHVASKVDIILDGAAVAKHYHRYHHTHHWVSYLLAPTTTIERRRDGQNHPATLAAVQVGEQLSILPTGKHSNSAQDIHVLLPHQVHGVVTGLAAGAIKIKIHHNGNIKNPAFDQEVVVPLAPGTPGTTVMTVAPKQVRNQVPQVAIAVGERVTVFPAGPPPHVAETVEIHISPTTRRGHIAAIANGTLMLKVHHPAAGGNPAKDTFEPVQLFGNPAIVLHQGKKAPIPGAPGDLMPGRDVTIHGYASGVVVVAATIHVEVPPLPKPKPPPPPPPKKK